jgi:DegV family protein with EDD domain
MTLQHRVAVVTDSTSYLPAGVADSLDVRIVPLLVELCGRTGHDFSDVSPADVTAAMRAGNVVTTSRPTPAEFVKTYEAALADGAESIVSVHLSCELSGTCDSARLAAAEFGDDVVRVVDSRSVAMVLGFAVMAAARASAAGEDAEAVARAALDSVARSSALFYVDSLEWLRRGGRVGPAAAVLDTALAVKPLLHLVDGRILPFEKVRTASKAIARLVELAVETAGDGEVEVAVQHLASPERAVDIARQLRDALPNLVALHESEVGAVVGAHVGPGSLGIIIAKR